MPAIVVLVIIMCPFNVPTLLCYLQYAIVGSIAFGCRGYSCAYAIVVIMPLYHPQATLMS